MSDERAQGSGPPDSPRRGPRRVATITAFPAAAPEPTAQRANRARPLIRPAGRTNLPAMPSPLIGRAADVAAVRDLLLRPDVRLVTLTGPPGIGKTRLALAVGAGLAPTFPDGVFFVDLAPLAESALVPVKIAQAIGVAEHGDRPMLEQLRRALRAETMLLVLDNFEQILEAAPQLADLLAACPAIRLVVTSRAPLHLRWEHEYPVPPLDLPDRLDDRTPEELAAIPAVALFVERAQAVQASFALDAQTGRTVAEICVRLEGLPLAIELAARQIRHFPLATLLARVTQRLPLPVSGPRDLPARQRTLAAAIAWSHNLLDASAQVLFRRLAVFVGGFSLDAVDVICVDRVDGVATPPDPLAALSTLVDHSLVRPATGPDGEPRYRMLESMREYAHDRLRASGEEGARRQRHAAYFLRLAEDLDPDYDAGRTPCGMLEDLLGRLARLEAEHENLRAALGWIADHGPTEESLRLAAALGWFWHLHGYLGEGRQWLHRALSRSGAVDRTLARATALHRLGVLAVVAGDSVGARPPLEESAGICRALGHAHGLAVALSGLANAMAEDDPRASETTAEALGLWRQLGSPGGTAWALIRESLIATSAGEVSRAEELLAEALPLCRQVDGGVLLANAEAEAGHLALLRSDRARARPYFERAVERYRALGAYLGASRSLSTLGALAAWEGDLARAAALQEQALDLVRYTNDPKRISTIRRRQGWVARAQGRVSRATELFQESVALAESASDRLGIFASLCELGETAVVAGHLRQAARLFAAAVAMREAISLAMPPRILAGYDAADVEGHRASIRMRLGADAFAAAWEEGRTVPWQELVSAAADPAGVRRPPLARTASPPDDPLTPREREVAALLADGLTNRQIADRLVISERTASTHVANILGKLGFATRAQIAAWSAQRSSPPLSRR